MLANRNTIVYDDFCKGVNCPMFLAHEVPFIEREGTYPCCSCLKMERSQHITEHPTDCLFIDEIQKWKLMHRIKYGPPEDWIKAETF